MNKKSFVEKLTELIFPENVSCYFCGKEFDYNESGRLCNRCKIEFERERKEGYSERREKVYSIFEYKDSVRQTVLRLKDSEKPYLAEVVAEFLKDAIEKEKLEADMIAYVPSSQAKIRMRGYDHMKRTANKLSKLTGLPVVKGLKRIKNGKDQTDVSEKERYENVKNVFRYEGNEVENKTLFLIDDVVTTGSTLSACIDALNINNPKKIICITFSAT